MTSQQPNQDDPSGHPTEKAWDSVFQRAMDDATSKPRRTLRRRKKTKQHQHQHQEDQATAPVTAPVVVTQPKRKRDPPKKPAKPATPVPVESESSSSSSSSDQDEDESGSDSDSEYDPAADGKLTNLLGRATLLLLQGSQHLEEAWKKNLTEDEIKRYGWIFAHMEDMQMDIPKILRSNLTDSEKQRAVYVMLNYQTNSQSYEEMARLIIKRRAEPIALEKMQHYEALERQLTETSRDRHQLKFQLLDLALPLDLKRIVWAEYEQWNNLDAAHGDYHKKFEWLQWVLRIPWNKYQAAPVISTPNQLRTMLLEHRAELDRHHYGLPYIKEEILLFMMGRYVPSLMPGQLSHANGRILAVEGSPGVGKTHLFRCLAKSCGMPFQTIAAGGCKDSSFWKGHGRTYEGAVPGAMVQTLRKMRVLTGMLYLDEIDKISDHEQSKDVIGVLLHILDETQNHEFLDDYIGSDLPIDLSHIFFVISINDREAIPPVLRDRLYIVKVPDPTLSDKLAMAQSIMIPEILQSYGLDPSEVTFSEETLTHIIKSKTAEEKGVRKFKQLLQAIIKRIAYLKHNLIALPNAAVWHAAQVAAVTALRDGTPMVLPPTAKVLSQEEKAQFAAQTSFYWPEFKLPLIITIDVVEKLLKHFQAQDQFDYVKAGWIA